MEVIYNVVPSRWGFEVTAARGIAPPTEDQLITQTDENGEEVLDENGAPVRIPGPDWAPQPAEFQLPTVVAVDGQDGDVVKLLFQPNEFGRFLATYVEYLDTEGRQVLYNALRETSDLEVPQLSHAALKLVKS